MVMQRHLSTDEPSSRAKYKAIEGQNSENEPPPSRGGVRLVEFLFLYLGAAFLLPQWLTPGFAGVGTRSLSLLVLSWLGWRKMQWSAEAKVYMLLASLFGACLVLSAVAQWDFTALSWCLANVIWFLIFIPGLGSLLRSPEHRRAFVFGLAVGAATYGAARIWGYFGGGPQPLRGAGGSVQWFLGRDRNQIDLAVAFVLPLLLLRGSREDRRWRVVASALAGVWLVFSGGRVGTLMAGVVAVAYLVFRPRQAGRVRAMAAVGLIGLVFLMPVLFAGGDATVSGHRVVAYLRGERTPEDELRGLALRKAWHVGWKNPFFGIGYSRLSGAQDAALKTASKGNISQDALYEGPWNLYAWIFAQEGAPAAVALLTLLFVALSFVLRTRDTPEGRSIALALVAVIVGLYFNWTIEVIYYPIALAFGAFGMRRSSVLPKLAAEEPSADSRALSSTG